MQIKAFLLPDLTESGFHVCPWVQSNILKKTYPHVKNIGEEWAGKVARRNCERAPKN